MKKVFKREFKELMDFWDIKKQVTRGHAYFAEPLSVICEISNRSQRILRGYHSANVDSAKIWWFCAVRPQPFCLHF